MIYFIILLNVSFLLFIAYFWSKIPVVSSTTGFNTGKKVCIIVPFRNEESELPELIASFNQLSYPNKEIYFINDHSDDLSVKIIKQFATFPFEIIELSTKTGKKEAITAGIRQTNAEFILTIDADCIVPHDLLENHLVFQELYAYNLICGMVNTKNNPTTLLNQLQKLEFLALMSSSGAFVQLQKPVMCNGAHLFYRKQIFEDVNGFEGNLDIPSGDDEFLLHKIAQLDPSKIGYLKTTVVRTSATKNTQNILNQRIRWAGKWKKSNSIGSKLTGFCVFVYHLSFCFLFLNTLFGCSASFLILWFGKLIPDYIFLNYINKSFSEKLEKLPTIIISSFYSFYVVLFGLLGVFSNTYTWKNRNFENDKRQS